MKTVGATTVTDAKSITSEKKVRKSLHPLQPAATDKENLVGAGREFGSSGTGKDAIKNAMSDKVKGDVKVIKTGEKPVIKPIKTETSKKVTEKPKNEIKKVIKDNKRNGRIFKDKDTQTEPVEKLRITSDDLTSNDGPSENYWKILAERRRIALQDALEENQILSDQLKVYKEMLDESRSLVEVLKDMIGEDRNDIDNSLDDSRL